MSKYRISCEVTEEMKNFIAEEVEREQAKNRHLLITESSVLRRIIVTAMVKRALKK